QEISQGWLKCRRFAAERARLPSAIAERHAPELPQYQSAHAAVEAGLDVFARLISDAEIPVKTGAAFVLATMIDRRADAASVILEAIDDEPDDGGRAAFLLALMVLAEQAPHDRVAQTAVRRFESVLDAAEKGDSRSRQHRFSAERSLAGKGQSPSSTGC